jgi:nitrite reductase/ring-hydroxylating ferredoxin subunit
VEAFVVAHDGDYFAYVNRCPHLGTPLDLWPNEFLSEDGRCLVCATHGAIYDPASGLCTAGPCVGDVLTALPLRRDRDDIVVTCPPP